MLDVVVAGSQVGVAQSDNRRNAKDGYRQRHHGGVDSGSLGIEALRPVLETTEQQ